MPLLVDCVTCRVYVKLSNRFKADHPDLASDLDDLYQDIATAKDLSSIGDCVPRLKHPEIAGKIWKFRVADKSEARGKSYGFRVIGFLRVPTTIYLVSIYEHKNRADMTREEYKKLVRQLETDIKTANVPEPPS